MYIDRLLNACVWVDYLFSVLSWTHLSYMSSNLRQWVQFPKIMGQSDLATKCNDTDSVLGYVIALCQEELLTIWHFIQLSVLQLLAVKKFTVSVYYVTTLRGFQFR